MPKKKPAWVRDGTIVSGGDTQIDLRDRRYKNWITIKATDRAAERITGQLLDTLNRDAEIRRMRKALRWIERYCTTPAMSDVKATAQFGLYGAVKK